MNKKFIFSVVLGIAIICAAILMPTPTFAMTGSGTEGDPFVIYNVTDLENIANNLSAYYELADDIDASSEPFFTPIGDTLNEFIGSLNGNNYTVSNLTISISTTGQQKIGFIVDNYGTIQNIKFVNSSISVTSLDNIANVGGLVFANAGNISNCYVTGIICATGNRSITTWTGAGGFAYYQWGNVEKCYADVDITATAYNHGVSAGGFIGSTDEGNTTECIAMGDIDAFSTDTDGTSWVGGFAYTISQDAIVSNCYATGNITITVSDEGYAGGFVSYTYDGGTILNCYSTGKPSDMFLNGGFCQDNDVAGNITACFWDTETSETELSDGGTGKTTSDMQDEDTFVDAGWDFNSVWMSCPSGYLEGYPYLQWLGIPCWDDLEDFTQVVWFQPNAIIEGTTLPNRTGEEDGIITWGANPAGITITHGELVPEDEYEFEPVIPEGQDIIQPNPESMTGDIDLEALRSHPLYPFVQILSIDGFLNERLVWIGLAWLIVIISMFLVHIGPDTRKGTNKPQHFILTTITGLGLTIMFYTMGIFPLWTIVLMAFGLVGAIIWERQPVI